MPSITNPTPIITRAFNRMWISSLFISYPHDAKPKGGLDMTLLPFDGTYILATGGRHVITGDITDPQLPASKIAAVLETSVKKLSGIASGLRSVYITATNPTQPVKILATFESGDVFKVADVFGLVAENAVFAQAFAEILNMVASLTELPVS